MARLLNHGVPRFEYWHLTSSPDKWVGVKYRHPTIEPRQMETRTKTCGPWWFNFDPYPSTSCLGTLPTAQHRTTGRPIGPWRQSGQPNVNKKDLTVCSGMCATILLTMRTPHVGGNRDHRSEFGELLLPGMVVDSGSRLKQMWPWVRIPYPQ